MMASYARREVAATVVLGAVATAVATYYGGAWGLIPAAATLGLLLFYRDPARRPPTGDNLVLAAADGKIVEIQRNAPGPGGQPIVRIMTFLSVFDVHVNRSPCAGEVTEVTYRPGEFLNALNNAADQRNEANALTLCPPASLPGPILVRQIAGVLARRIVCAARVGDRLAAGERFGMIKLGSRTEVCLPEDPRWEIRVRLGEHVRGGLTVLARWSG